MHIAHLLIVVALLVSGCRRTEAKTDIPPESHAKEISYMQPTPGEVEEALKHPNGWVYRIKGNFRSEEAVPPEAIVGAWKVDSSGKIIGNFIPNPKHVATFEKK